MELISFSDLPAFFEGNLVIVFLFYGLSFLLVASAILLSFKSFKAIGLSRAFLYLFLFSVVHGTVELIDMSRQYRLLIHDLDLPGMILYLRFYMLTASFYFLLLFGLDLLLTTKGFTSTLIRRYTFGLNIAFLFFLSFIAVSGYLKTHMAELDGGARYLLGFPSAILAGISFLRLSRNDYKDVLPEDYSRYFRYSSVILISYGVFTGIVVPKSNLLFASFINQNVFFEFTGIPVQILRAMAAFLIANSIIRAMALRISHRLMLGFIAFFFTIVILGWTGFINMKLIVKSYNDVLKIETEEKDVSSMYKSFNRLFGFVTGPNAYKGKDYNPLLKDYIKDFRYTLDEIEAMEHEDVREKEMISQISVLFQKSIGQEEGISRKNLERLKSIIEEINLLHSGELREHKEKVRESIRNFYLITSIVVLLSLLGFNFLWYHFYKMVIRPIKKLTFGTGQIAEGNLRYKIDVHTADEIQECAREFNIMGERLLERTERLETVMRELEELSVKDGLTGLFNRRFFNNKMKEEIKRAVRYHKHVSLLLMDMDDFKHYNDHNGHLQGDSLLKTVGEIIGNNIRVTDFACRYGGEEFMVILPETDSQEAEIVAERIRRAIQEHAFPYEETQPLGDVTVTMGGATCPDDSEELNELIKKADDLLYKAKREGKNKAYLF